MMKHMPHKNLTGVKNGTKPPLIGHCIKADISTRKCNRRMDLSCRPGKLANDPRFKKNRHQRLNKKVTAGQNIIIISLVQEYLHNTYNEKLIRNY